MPSLLRAHLAHLRRTNARHATLRDRRDNILRFVTWLGDILLSDVTHEDVERYQDYLADRVRLGSLAIGSTITYLAHLRAFYGWAFEYEHVERNPASRITKPRMAAREPRPVPMPEFRTALRTARGDMRAMLILAGYLGLRAGEIARIRGEDVSHELLGAFLLVHGKGGKERTVPVPAVLLAELAPWLTKRGPIFIRPKGTPATPHYVSVQISEHFHGLGMPYTAHMLRHRSATRLLQLTKDLRLVQKVLGHGSPGTTAGYTLVSDQYAFESVSALGGELSLDLRPPGPEDEPPAAALAAAA